MGDRNYLSDTETLQKPFRALALAPWRRDKKLWPSKNYLCLSKSTKQTAIQPSTLRIRFGFLLVVIFSTSRAYSSSDALGKFSRANCLTNVTRLSGLLMDLTRWPMPMISLPSLRVLLTNSMGMRPESKASVNMEAAPSSAPPNRSPWGTLDQRSWFLLLRNETRFHNTAFIC